MTQTHHPDDVAKATGMPPGDLAALKFWQSAVQGRTESTPLAMDGDAVGGKAASDGFLPAVADAQLASTDTALLRELAGQQGLRLGTIVHGAWAILLSRYSREEEVLFGAGTKTLCAVMPVRVQIDEKLPVTSFLQTLEAQCAERERHASVLSSNEFLQLYSSILAITDSEADSPFSLAKEVHPLVISVALEGELRIQVRFDTQRFQPDAMTRLLGHFRTLLLGIAADGRRPIAQLPMLTAAERVQLIKEWVQPPAALPADQRMHALFEQWAARTPDAVALVFQEQQLTYAELDGRANQLAHHLRALGVGPEVLVGLCVERSFELIIGLLGILKAGGGYVPLDAGYPTERLLFMMQDCAAPLLVTLQKHAPIFRDTELRIVCLDTDQAQLDAHSKLRPAIEVKPENAAYVIYTSGSTGRPKGALIEHRNVCSLAQAQHKLLAMPREGRMLQFASICFDASVHEILLAFAAGAQLVVSPASAMLPGTPLIQTLQKQRITHLFLAPSALAVLPDADLPALTDLIIGGEVLTLDLVKKWAPGRRFHQAYGPTETTVFATLMEVVELRQRTPIGRPLDNTQIYILDRHLQPVPIGVPGEIYIGGNGLARAYLNRPELTQARFIPSPFAKGARLYKSGDLGRYLPDGNIEFLGRIDTQIKLRGFRIELGEIESVLRQHPGVQNAAVDVRELGEAGKVLVAYVVAQNKSVDSAELQGFLRQRLPEYMLPALFIEIAALPVTAGGKLERRRLPDPVHSRPDAGRSLVAPRSPTEEAVARLFSELFGVPSVSTTDDFYELGGHSLTAARLAARVQTELGVKLPLSAIFAHPTVAELAKQVEAHAQREDHAPVMKKVARHDFMPVTFAQERVYFIQEVSPEGSAYQAQSALRFSGLLDAAALARSIAEMVRRHEIFRTTFPAVNGRLTQSIQPFDSFPMALPEIDLRSFAKPEQTAQLQHYVTQEGRKPFFLDRLPLVRWLLLTLSDREHVLIYTEHHLVHDGWSLNLFLRELLEIYQAFVQGQPVPLPEPAFQFVDFAVWQRQWAVSPEAQKQLTYWQRQLTGAPALLELPLNRPRPAEQTYCGDQVRVELPLPLCEGLRALGRQEQATLFMTMLAAFLILLQRYTGQNDLCVGSAVANRRSREVEGLIGMIVNNVVLRTTLEGNPTFKELLAQVRQVTLEGYASEDLPFDKIVEALKPTRDLSYNPLFQVMFSFHDSPVPDLKLPDLTIGMELALSNKSSKFDLDVVAIPHAERRLGQSLSNEEKGITFIWEYNTDLFDKATIQRMEEQYETLVAAIIHNPEARIAELPILPPAQQEWLRTWNATAADYPLDLGVYQLFEQQAARTPSAIAVISGATELTYRELDERTNQLAHHLRARGVKAESLVGLCVERSPEMLIGMLGVLKAGGAYVPIDPAYPAERIAYILEDTQRHIMLTQERLRQRFAAHGGETIALDAQWPAIAQHSAAPLQRLSQPHDLAYMIYTSGSLGKPKGVMIEQRSLTNFAHTAADWYRVRAEDRLLQFASISFDTAVEEIYPSLLRGATLLLRSEAMLHSGDDFWATCQKWQVTVLNFPTAFWHQLVAELKPDDPRIPASVRLVIVGGEEAQLDKVRHWHRAVAHLNPPPQLYNGYGPTEGTVTTTLHCCDSPDLGYVPIGRPLGNTQVYLLDRNLHQVPIGVAGELCIGGVPLARGYFRLPELTADRFITNPIAPELSPRLYRTGDLGRLRPDGNLEYLGRLDDQVKIRGFRIELGEIETVLAEHPAVRQAFVVVRKEEAGQKRLVAYVVPREPQLSGDELRRFLREKLPSYMVPSAFVCLPALPLTPSGKVDQRALPVPELGKRASPRDGGDSAATPKEAILLTIWAEILRAPHVGINDNFFELGGDSIISIQVVARARQAGLELSPKQLFRHQTIAELAAAIDDAPPRRTASQEAVIGAVPLTPIQSWFFAQQLPEPHYFNQSMLLQTPADLDAACLRESVAHLLRHHDALRLRYANKEGQWLQESAPIGPEVPFHVTDLSALDQAAQRDALQAAEAALQRSLNLTVGPLLRAELFQRGAGRTGWLLLTVHHLAVDGVSWRILFEDLATAYEQLHRGARVQLPAKTTSFQDWANRLAEYAESAALISEAGYWVAGGAVPALPVDWAETPAASTLRTTATVTVSLSEDETRALLQDVPAAYGTQISDVLLTALAQSLSAWTGTRALRLDLEGHGREEVIAADLSRTVGWFTTLFPVRLELPADDRPGEALKSIKEQLRQIPNRGIGYGVLRYLQKSDALSAKLAALPAAEISFNYLGQFDQALTASADLGVVQEFKLAQSELGLRSHPLAIAGMIRAGRLEIHFSYSASTHQRATLERVAAGFMTALRALIAHCRTPSAGGYTPSDFAAAQIDQKRLDKLMSKLKRPKQESSR